MNLQGPTTTETGNQDRRMASWAGRARKKRKKASRRKRKGFLATVKYLNR